MEVVTSQAVLQLVEQFGRRAQEPVRLYLLGGSAMLLLGSPRATKDIDYDLDVGEADNEAIQRILGDLAGELRLDIEFVPLAEFVPLPPGFVDRHRLIGRFGMVELFVFDPYSLALSKIARGFEADLEDVRFLHRTGIVHLDELRSMFNAVLPDARQADVDPVEFKQYFAELERLIEEGGE